MKVAVLLSTYNGEKYLSDQIDSLIEQEGDFEIHIIVRDDGSTDKTQEMLDEYKQRGVLEWYSGTNLKSAKSYIDLLFDCGEFDFYCFCDQDDVWDLDKISTGIQKIINENVPCIYFSNVVLVDANLRSYGVNVYKRKPHFDFYTVSCASNIIGCTMIINNQLVEYLRKHEKPEVVAMHDSFVSRVCLSIGGKIIYDPNPHMKYRQHMNNVIGVKYSFFGKIDTALKSISKKPNVSIDNQAKEILRLYSEDICETNKTWLEKIANYRQRFVTRVELALSRNMKFSSKYMSIQMRMAILFGNR